MAGTTSTLPSCITGQTTTNGSTVVPLSTTKAPASAPETSRASTGSDARSRATSPTTTRATSGRPRVTAGREASVRHTDSGTSSVRGALLGSRRHERLRRQKTYVAMPIGIGST